jgi:hypothetical protein
VIRNTFKYKLTLFSGWFGQRQAKDAVQNLSNNRLNAEKKRKWAGV